MHIAIVGPIASADLSGLLNEEIAGLPQGYEGAPLLATLATELLARGHRVTAITLSTDISLDRPDPVRSVHGNFEVIYCPMRSRAWRPNGFRPGRIVDLYAFERRRLRHAIEMVNPDVVHAHWAYEFSLAALASGLPHVITCHDSPYGVARFFSKEKPTRSLYRWLRVLMARKTLREAKCVTTVSPYMRDEVQPLTRARIEVVPNPVDTLALSLGQERIVPRTIRIAMVCNGWSERKNPQPALRAFAQFRKANPRAELHLYGHDFGVGQIAEHWARQQGAEAGMIFCGVLPHHRLLHAMSGTDLLLHPALEESFGMVVAEAMALGLPVVAGKTSGAVPWVLGAAGALCDVCNANDIYRAMVEVIEPGAYLRSSQSGRLRVREEFTQGTVATAYLSAYSRGLAAGVHSC